MNYHFSSVARKVSAEAPINTSKPEGSINQDYYVSFIPKKKEPFKFKEITQEQIIKCVSKMKNSKSSKIPTMFVKDTIEVTAPILSVIFNKSSRKGVFPKKPQNRKICPVYKGKGSKSDHDNYRPIPVLSVIARVFEKLIHEQLFPYFNDYLYKNQSGFRP